MEKIDRETKMFLFHWRNALEQKERERGVEIEQSKKVIHKAHVGKKRESNINLVSHDYLTITSRQSVVNMIISDVHYILISQHTYKYGCIHSCRIYTDCILF